MPGVLHQCSEIVLWKFVTFRCFLINLWGRKWSPHPILVPSGDPTCGLVFNSHQNSFGFLSLKNPQFLAIWTLILWRITFYPFQISLSISGESFINSFSFYCKSKISEWDSWIWLSFNRKHYWVSVLSFSELGLSFISVTNSALCFWLWFLVGVPAFGWVVVQRLLGSRLLKPV